MKYRIARIVQIFSLEKNRFVDDYIFENLPKNWNKISQEKRLEISTKMNNLRQIGFKVRLITRRIEC
jgi:hypothetical protein